MGDVIFVKTRYQDVGYESYRDFWRLVELARYPVCYVDEIDAQAADRTYIITPLNGEWQAGWPDAKARIVHWDLEWRLDGDYPSIPGVAETWASDRWYCQRIGAKYVPMGSDARLREHATNGASYDVALLAYMVPRRQQIAHDLDERGVTRTPTGAWGDERASLLNGSRVYLHVHQHDHAPTVAPLRMVIAAAYKLPVISETVMDRGVFGYTCMMTADYGRLVDFVCLWTRDHTPCLTDYGAALHSLLCEDLTFRTSVERAL